jgi:hypothetical protein
MTPVARNPKQHETNRLTVTAYEALMLEAFAAGARDLVRAIGAEQRGVA